MPKIPLNKKKKIKFDDNKGTKPFNHSFIGPRMKQVRKAVGEPREHLAEILGITVSQYGLLELKTIASVPNFIAIINYFLIKHDINPSWILAEDNSLFPMYVTGQKDMGAMITELNEKVKDQGLMVSLVPKV